MVRASLSLLLILAIGAESSRLVAQPPLDQGSSRPPVLDPQVEPAQLTTSPVRVPFGGMPGVMEPLGDARLASLPPQPPTPQVQIMVLVPQDLPPGKDMTCTIRIMNSSGADAHRVRVRMPKPDGMQTLLKAEPTGIVVDPDTTWDFKTLKAGETQRIELTMKPIANASSVSVKAFVSFEHGQTVKTTISEPKLKVKTEVPKQPNAEEPIPVRVTITNTGRVPVTNVKLTENISDGFDYPTDTEGEPTKDNPRQRVWPIGTVPPGMQKTVQYQLTTVKGRSLLVQSVVTADGQAQLRDEAEAKVVEAALKVELRGDGQVTGETAAFYEAVVTNTGSMPLTNVRVTGSVPTECRLSRMTRGGQESRDAIVWTIPKLAPGDKESVRWGLQSTSGGRKSVRATATARSGFTPERPGMLVSRNPNRIVEDTAVVETAFQGRAMLNWETRFDQATVPIDKSGMLTIRISNSGTEPAANVRLVVDLPKDVVSLIEATPRGKAIGSQVVFEGMTLPAGRTETYSITFRGERFGRATFAAKLAADVLGDRPLGAEKYVEIVRR